MDFHDFLQQFIALDMAHVAAVAVFVGSIVFGLIRWADVTDKNSGGAGLNPQIQFWGAVALSFLIPLGAYFIDATTQKTPVSINGVFLAMCVGFSAATAIHWVTVGAQKALALHNAKKGALKASPPPAVVVPPA